MIVHAGNGTLTPASPNNYATITFTNVGNQVDLLWDGVGWTVIDNYDCTIA